MKKRPVIFQRTREFKGNIDRLNEKWIRKAEEIRNPFVNSDDILESEGFYFEDESEEKKILRQVLRSGGLNLLTDQEYKVFQLVYRQGFSLRDTGKLMRVNQGSVHNYSRRLAKKLRYLIDGEMIYQNAYV